MISLVAAAIASFWAGFLAGSLLLALCIFYRSHLLLHLTSFSQLCICTFIWLVNHFQYSWAKPCDQTELHGRMNYGYQIFSPLIKVPCDLRFLDDEEAFVSLMIIGSGGCGVVYTAQLPSCREKLIAVKKIHHLSPMGETTNVNQVEDTRMLNSRLRQIRSEIKTAGQIRHRNLLPLLAHVSRPNCHFLIYEFQKNGSLQHLLENVQAGSTELPGPDRQKIATGIAAGLEYLHMHNSCPIIHRDLKPANILLSDQMEALITDFGLAKVVKEYSTTTRVVGTVGYIAPEYYQTLKFTDKSDIYSFGVILGALVTGMLPSDEFFQMTDEMCPVKWLRKVVSSENPYQAIDQKLLGGGYEDQMLLVLRIACFCTLDNPGKRPNSKEVLFMLSQIES